MRLILFLFLIFSQNSFAESNLTKEVKATFLELVSTSSVETNSSKEGSVSLSTNQIAREKLKQKMEEKRLEAVKKAEIQKRKYELARLQREEEQRQILVARLTSLIEEQKIIDDYLSKDNLWNRTYSNHETYQKLSTDQKRLNDKILALKEKLLFNKGERKKLEKYEEEYQIIEGKLSQLKEYKDDPFKGLLESPKISKEPSITNPIDIITALSFQKQMESSEDELQKHYQALDNAVTKLYRKSIILQEMVIKTRGKTYNNYVDELRNTEHKLSDFERTLKIFKITVEAYERDVSQMNFKINENIEHEIKKSIVTGSIILFLLLFFFFIKYLVKKYMSENELYYGTNKVINFLFIALVFIILLFSYLEDVENLVQILSFASAGIAIALKDWFMSLMGWVVILVSGSIHVGDRVKFVKDGVEYVGDIVDISVLRMTLHEDVTLTTIYTNRRTGRMIFIPNNYIFTDMIANYSHSGLKTVWDGIDFMVTFDSNIAKAQSIAKEVTRKYSKGYTDMTRKQLNRLRSKYSMRNTAVEPRVFGFFDTYGVKISAWYLTNAYATLTLRSTISMEILSRLKEEDDIFLAFPSQSLYMDKSAPKNVEGTLEEPPLNEVSYKETRTYKPDDWGLY
jgi:small-conductance mechanosensitive channel